jgi:hypothetical protein
MKKTNFYSLAMLSLVIILSSLGALNSQGCVAVRQMGGLNMCSSNSYNLLKGDFQMGVNYRYFHSWRHYVGTEEQPQRQTTGGGHDEFGNDRGNAVNIYSHALDFNFSYGLSSRLQLNFTIPYLHNERSQVLRQTTPKVDTFRYSVYADGIGDFRLGLNYWVYDPETAHRGNLMVGLGIKLPTGKFDATDNQVPQSNGTKLDYQVMDQAIQPGDGGLGFSVELQGFRHLFGNFYGFANGYYLFNPKETNGAYKSSPDIIIKNPIDSKVNMDTLVGNNRYACPDQYFVRAGIMTTVLNNLSLSLAARWEGIPADDVFGGQEAYRRPGYVVSIEPGIAYRLGNHNFSLYVPKNFIRNRIQSHNDKLSEDIQRTLKPDAEVHGDAAFADYSISFGYTYRFNSHKM